MGTPYGLISGAALPSSLTQYYCSTPCDVSVSGEVSERACVRLPFSFKPSRPFDITPRLPVVREWREGKNRVRWMEKGSGREGEDDGGDKTS